MAAPPRLNRPTTRYYVTAIDITIEVKVADGRRDATWWPQFRVIDTADVTPDPEVAAVVAEYEQQASAEMDVPLGMTAVALDSRTATVRTREAAIGNIVADAMRAAAHADVAIMNGGGIRGGKLYAANTPITRRDVLAELPFGNRVVTVEIDGRALKAAIENGLSQLPNAAGRFPQVSGLMVEADLKRPAGSRVTAIKVGDAPLDEAQDLPRRHQRFHGSRRRRLRACWRTRRPRSPTPMRRRSLAK